MLWTWGVEIAHEGSSFSLSVAGHVHHDVGVQLFLWTWQHHVVSHGWYIFASDIFLFMYAWIAQTPQIRSYIQARPKMVRQDSVFDAISRLSVASHSLTEAEHRDALRLCEVGKMALNEFGHDLVLASNGRPLLYEYVGDGTPLKLKYHMEASVSKHDKSHRSGYSPGWFYQVYR